MNTQQALRTWLRDESAHLTPPASLLAEVLATPQALIRRQPMPAWRPSILVFAALALLLTLAASYAFFGGGPTVPPPPSATPAPPDGYVPGQIVFDNGRDVFIADADGSFPRRLTDSAGTGFAYDIFQGPNNPQPGAWYGDRVLVVGKRESDRANVVQLVPVRDGAPITLARFTDTFSGPNHLDIAAAADGSRFAIETDFILIVRSGLGEAVATIPLPPGYDRWGVTDVSSLSWSADGHYLLVTACTAVCQKGSDPGQDALFLIDMSTADPTIQQVFHQQIEAWTAQISPEGSRFVYEIVADDGWGEVQIWVADSDGTNARQLDSLTGSWINGWAPDGIHLSFTMRQPDNTNGPWTAGVVNVDNGTRDTRQFPSAPLFKGWSPDGANVAFAHWSSGLWSLSVLAGDLQGEASAIEFPGSQDAYDAAWSWVPAK